MVEVPRIKVGIDYDGVIVKKAKGWDLPRRASKMGLPNLPGAIEGIDALRTAEDVDIMGVYTVRPEWLRRGQTDRQIRRRGLPIEKVTHTTNSSKEKIKALLYDATQHATNNDRAEDFTLDFQVVLIDDSVEKIVAGARQLYKENPNYRNLLRRFTLAAFNSRQQEQLKGMIVPNVVHVVTMQNWSDVGRMLDTVRSQGPH